MTEVLGAVVIVRNGDRLEMYQDPKNYASAFTQTTALGEVQSYDLGSLLRSTYLNPGSSSYIQGIRSDIVDNNELHVRVKAGGEGTVVFDSAIALLQGLFPPNPNHKIKLANETTVQAPLKGYQYVPVETVEPGNDRSLESWTSCPNFEKHISKVMSSDEFKKKAKEAEPFFKGVKDFVFGRPLTLENSWNLYDFINTQLTYNKTYAYRLPPTYHEQARALANFRENAIFSDDSPTGIGNIAGRTILHTILSSLQRIEARDDPLQFVVVETTYQPFISLFHQTDMIKEHPQLKGIPDFASTMVIELRRGAPPDLRDFLRFRFKNGTQPFETVHVFGHREDIPLTEFIYRIDNAAITSNREWQQACGAKNIYGQTLPENFGFNISSKNTSHEWPVYNIAMMSAVFLIGLFAIYKVVADARAASRKKREIRLAGEENLAVQYPVGEKMRFV